MARSLRGLFRKSGGSALIAGATAGSVAASANTPGAITGALNEQGMNLSGNFGPGAPLTPYFGYSQRTRATDFPVGVNISTQSRASWGRVSFDTLKALIDAYDVARMCINHKIDELRSMPLMYQPADSIDDDVDDAIDAAKAALAYPDRELPYDSWLSKWLENAFKYDSAPLYRRRNFDGDVIGLEVVDGRTINPYIDANGRRPLPPAPAYYQTVHGMVADWLTSEDIIYNPFRPQEDSPFGLAPIESIILTANTDIRFQWHFLQMFTEGSVPAGFMEVPPDVSSPDQVAEWQDYWDATVMGDQAKLHQLIAVPSGSKYSETRPRTFDPKFPEYLMMRTCAAFGVVPQDLGLVKDVNRANGETQVDVQFRVNTMPWVRYVEGHLTRYLQHDLGLPVKISLDTGRDKEDRLAEAQAHQLYVDMGAESPDEVRVDILGKRIDRERPTPRFYSTQRIGPVPLLAIEGVAGITDPDTYGPAKQQKALDQPFVPPIGVIPHPGSTDDKASQAAIDSYQVSERQQLDAEEGGSPNRESSTERDARGATAAPQEPGAEAVAPPAPPAPVAKAADQEGELAAFRVFVKGAKRRGGWDRDFSFTTVPPAIAAELNRGGRAEVAQIAKAKADATTRAVYEQLAEDFPPEAIEWVRGVRWTGPVSVPLDKVDFSNQDTWAATSQPDRVDKTVRKIRAGKPVKPAVLIERPGHDALMVADGHHRAEGAQRVGVPVRAYVAHPDKAVGPWDEMHASQQVEKAGDSPKAPAPDPQGPDDVRQWPGWARDQELARIYADRIRQALTVRIDTADLAARWMAVNGIRKAAGDDGEDDDTAADDGLSAAQDWLDHQGVRNALTDVLRAVLGDAWTEGYILGDRSATSAVTGHRVDWGAWTPGDPEAANLVLGHDGLGSGLQQMLSAVGIQIKSIGNGRFDDLARALALSLENGDSVDTLARDLRDILDDAGRAQMVAVTEIARAVSAASLDTYRANGIPGKQWLIASGACAICQDNADAGVIPLDAEFPSGDDGPPGHPRCFPAGVLVTGPSVLAATARRYEGDLVTIVFADGQEVPVTPNHPVLTPDGWVAAGDLHEGCDVLRARDPEWVALSVDPDNHQAVARIEQVAVALREAGPVTAELVPLAAEDFHGDGAGDDHVQVVRTARDAEFDLVAELAEHRGHGRFQGAQWLSGAGLCDAHARLFRSRDAFGSLMGSVKHPGPLLGASAAPAELHRLGSVPAVDIGLAEHSVDRVAVDSVLGAAGLHRDAGQVVLDEAVGRGEGAASGDAASMQRPEQDALADSRGGLSLAGRLAGLVEADRVVELRRVRWSGHVYNLETSQGWYFANGIVAHNCRCAPGPGFVIGGASDG